MANYGITLQGYCQTGKGYGNYPINGKKPGSLRRGGQNVLKIRDLGVQWGTAGVRDPPGDATFDGISLSCKKNTMHQLLLSMPGGAEWILILLFFIFFIGTPVAIGFILFRLLKSNLKSTIRETIEEMKAEGRI